MVSLLPLCLLLAPFAADDPLAIKLAAGDRIVFLGDSITEAGAGPEGYISLLRKALAEKKPELKLALVGAGISGNKVPDLQKRLERDVLAKKPSVVVIYIGINDVWHGQADPKKGTSPEAFAAGLREVIGKCQAAGAKVLLCTPSVIGEKKKGANPLDARLDAFAELSRKTAKEMDVPLCDLRRQFVEHLEANNPKNQAARILTTDGVHLNAAGNAFVAKALLKALAGE